MLGKIEGRRRRGWQRMRCLDGIADSMDMSLSKLQDSGGVLQFKGLQRAGLNLATEQQLQPRTALLEERQQPLPPQSQRVTEAHKAALMNIIMSYPSSF